MNALLSIPSGFLQNLDLFLIALFIAFGIWGALRGMFRQLAGSLATLVAIIFAGIFCKAVYTLLIKLPIFNTTLYNWIYNITNGAFSGLREISASDIPVAVDSLPFVSSIKETILNYSQGNPGAKINLNVYVARAVTNYTVLAFSFLLLFFLVKILFKLIKSFGESLREIESIKKVDGILGAILGLFGIFRKLSFILFIIKIIPFTFLDGIKQAIDSSFIASFITEHNIVEWILSLMKL